MSEKALNVLIIAGTVRQGRNGRKVADWYHLEAKKAAPQHQYQLLDAAELNLPLFDQAMPPSMHKYNEAQTKLAETIGWADAFVVIAGEYNHGYTGSLKNLLDYIYSEWNRKVVAYVGYGGLGGGRAVEQLIPVFAELQVASLRQHVYIMDVWAALDEHGAPKDSHKRGDIAKQLEELTWWGHALKAARTAS